MPGLTHAQARLGVVVLNVVDTKDELARCVEGEGVHAAHIDIHQLGEHLGGSCEHLRALLVAWRLRNVELEVEERSGWRPGAILVVVGRWRWREWGW